MEAWNGFADRLTDIEVEVAREARVDPALQADLHRAAIPRLTGPADDLVQRHEVRATAEVRGQLAFRERAEPAAEVTDVRVVDVARHDVRDVVARDLLPKAVGGGGDDSRVAATGAEDGDDVVLVEVD